MRNEEQFDLDKGEEDLAEIDERMKVREAQGLADVYKYFDRINDKLLSFNNVLIAGYFVLVTFKASISKMIVLVPLANMVIVMLVDYIMMEQGRLLSQIRSLPVSQINKYGRRQNWATWLSFIAIITTAIVTIIFIYLLNTTVAIVNPSHPLTQVSSKLRYYGR